MRKNLPGSMYESKYKESLEEFKEIYKKYCNKDLVYTLDGRFLLIQDNKCDIALDKLYQLTDFYNFRLKNNLTSTDKLTFEDYNYLNYLLHDRNLTYHVPSIIFEVSKVSFGYAWRIEKECQAAHERLIKGVERKWEAITWKGVTQSCDAWGKEIKISPTHFRTRIKTYGLCDLIFMEKKEFRKHKDKYQKLDKIIPSPECGTQEWNSYSDKRPENPNNGTYIYRELDIKPEDITQKSVELLVEGLILDAKQDIVYNTQDRDDAEKFLCNYENCMVFLLSAFSHVYLSSSLRALRKYCEKYPKTIPKKRKCSRGYNNGK